MEPYLRHVTRSPLHPAILILAFIGTVWATRQLYNLASFAYLHLLHQSQLSRYQQPATNPESASWALITGASDGIGKGFAEELCAQGFNVILHGRNESKLTAVRTALLQQWPDRQVELLVIDASTASPDNWAAIETAARRFRDLPLRILINNVAGGETPLWVALRHRAADHVTKCLDITAQFPTQITRAFLPQLISRSPALILDIGSGISDLPAPYLSFYGGAKAYVKAWSRSLAAEMKAEGHDVEVLLIQVGMVSTNSARRETSLFVPSARRFAQASLGVVGCGRDEVWAYWPHAVQFAGLIMNLPGWVMGRAVLGMARKEKAREEARLKQR